MTFRTLFGHVWNVLESRRDRQGLCIATPYFSPLGWVRWVHVQWHISYPSISIPADVGDDKASELRETVAAVVLSDPDTSGAVEIRAGLWAEAAKDI